MTHENTRLERHLWAEQCIMCTRNVTCQQIVHTELRDNVVAVSRSWAVSKPEWCALWRDVWWK